MLRLLFTVLSAVSVLLPTLALCVGCKRDTSAADAAAARVRMHQSTMSHLDHEIAAIKRSEDIAHYSDLVLPAYERARAWLATVPPSTHVPPQPVLAGLQRRDGWQGPRLTLMWLESGFEAHGLRLADEAGDVVVVDNVYAFSTKEMVERGSTLRRVQVIDVAEPGSSLQGPGVVRVPRPLTSPKLKVMLRYGPGTESPPVAVYLDDMRGAPNAGATTRPD